jgi:hypothetical protein
MKKTLLTLTLLLSTTFIFAQRTIEWELVEIVEPTSMTSTDAGTSFTYKIKCTNNSATDTVYATDTIGVQLIGFIGANAIFALPNATSIALKVLGVRVNPGDTVDITGTHTPAIIPVRPNLSVNATLRITTELLNRKSGAAGITREGTATIANNSKTKAMIWYCPQGWGVNVNTLNTDVVSVYPNPANGVLNINLNVLNTNNLNNVVEIVDVTGKVVLTENINNFAGNTQLDVSSLDKGIYIVRVSNGINTFTSKVIVD